MPTDAEIEAAAKAIKELPWVPAEMHAEAALIAAERVRGEEMERNFYTDIEEARTQPETGQPDRYLYDAGYGAGVRDAEARIVALIEADEPPEPWTEAMVQGYRAAKRRILNAIQEDTDE